MKTVRSVVADALVEARDEGLVRKDQPLAELGARLALILSRRLHESGYAIHDARNCIRVPGEPPGRLMTADEREWLGVPEPAGQPS